MSVYRRYVVEGRRPGPRLLIMAGIHGDECEPMMAVAQLRERMDPAQLSGRVTLIPIANESAYHRSARTGEDALDLARTFPGNPHGSITERLAAELNEEIKDSDFLIDLHTGGTRLEIVPMSGFMLHADAEVLARQRQMAEWFNLPVVWGTSAELPGRSLSAARDANVPAIYAECGGGGMFRMATVDAYLAGCLQVMAGLAMIPPVPYNRQVRCRIDDAGTGSGHLQSCHPAPLEGMFVPSVALGDRVLKGQLVGRIVDLLAGTVAPVVADRDGLVLMLYTAAHVDQGTGLCVVVQVDEH